MRTEKKLEEDARGLASWLRANAVSFAPLQIVRVDPSLDTDSEGEQFIRLTVVLEDPADSDEGWPLDATFRLYRAVREEVVEAEHGLAAYVHLQSVSDEAA